LRTSPPHHTRHGFRNPWPDAELKGFLSLFRWFIERRTIGRPPPDPDPSTFARVVPRVGVVRKPGEVAVTWIGHSTVLLEFAGCRVLTDPMWGEHAAPFPIGRLRRWVPPPLPLETLPPVDLALLSHNHYDHLDVPTIRALARIQPGIEWCVPLGLSAFLRRLGVRQAHEFDWWDERTVGPATIGVTPAQHFSARGPLDRNRTLWCGFAVRVGSRSVYFAGDTGYHPEFGRIGERFGPFDLQLMPIGAYEPRWFMRAVHMNPEDALTAFKVVAAGRNGPGQEDGSSIFVPIHWGTFKLTDEPMDEPPRRLQVAWLAAGLEAKRLWQLAHGETRMLA
jgi:N-acyl-phosphatidylethanolamine-hydrolysing phospholipase D